MKFKNLAAAALLIFSFYACSKSSTATDAADQFQGVYTGTYKIYQGGTLDTMVAITGYQITKASADDINLLGEPSSPVVQVVGNTFSGIYSITTGGALYNYSITGALDAGLLTETGTIKASKGSVTANYTFSANYKKQ